MTGGPIPAVGEGAGDVTRVLARSQASAVAYQTASAALEPPLHVRARLEGRGRVFRLGQRLDDVDYWFKTFEESDALALPAGAPELSVLADARPVERSLSGFVRASARANRIGLVGVPLTLELADGRLLDFAVVKVLSAEETLYSTYLVQGYGEPRAPARA